MQMIEPPDSGFSARTRLILFVGSIVPLVAVMALLGWSLIHFADDSSGFRVNNAGGDVLILSGQSPSFSLAPLGGGPAIENDTLLGKIVMLDFWSSWCPPCRAEAAGLVEVYREYDGAPVEFVGIAIWDLPSDVLHHISRFEVGYPNGLDERGTMAVDFGVRALPEKYFLNGEGDIVRRYSGPIEPQVLRSILDELISQL